MNKQDIEVKRKVLVVDNDVDITRLVEKTLGKTGEYEVISVNKPARALGMVRQHNPDLILMDALMPVVNGTEIAMQLSREDKYRHIPIIFISSLLERSDTGPAGKRIGGYMCLAKPFMPGDLLNCIRKVNGKKDRKKDVVYH